MRALVALALVAACAAPLAATGGERVTATAAPALRRRATWGFSTRAGVVRKLDPASPAARAGLREGDKIARLNGKDFTDTDAFRAHGGDRVTLSLAGRDVAFTLDPMPLERWPGVETTYGVLQSERGHRLRTIVTRPVAARAPVPGIFFVPWLSCDSLEAALPTKDGTLLALRLIAERANMATMRVERPGLGDSEGPDCGDATLEDDMAGFREGLRRLRATPGVDPSRIFIVGASIGGGLAPILAKDGPVKGVVAIGGFTKTWYEHMLEIERRRMVLEGHAPSEVNEAMRGLALFYTEYLANGRTPKEVIAAHPELAPLWTDEPTRQYGRPAAYYQAVQRLNVEAAWASLDAPALVVWGEYDWIMSKDDQERAVALVGARHSATLLVAPKAGHGLNTFASLEASFKSEGAGVDDRPAAQIVDWLRAHAD
jgi:pimeloyl-ACP methyl ester carboxylesterase